MKRILVVAVLILAVSSLALSQSKGSQSTKKVEDALIKLDKEWTAAEIRGDKKAVGLIVADDFVETIQGGKVQNKTEYLAGVEASTDKDTADDYVVRVFGNMAIMTHRGTVVGERNFQYRSTHVWMKRGARWVLIAHHGGEIMPAATP